jgi:hypothetical protein
MFVITKSKSGNDVSKALYTLIDEVNEEMEKIGGLISGIDCDVNVGPLEASVSASVFIDGDQPREKFLIGVNEKGYNRENSMNKAETKVNSYLEDRGGKIAGEFVKTITILPERVYTTLIIAVNGQSITDSNGVDTLTRRRRIKKSLELLGNDPMVLNIAKLANQFGVSRTMIYKDLEVLGYKRS